LMRGIGGSSAITLAIAARENYRIGT